MPKSTSNTTALSRTEWRVMNSVWKHCPAAGNITVSELIERAAQERKWNFSTLKTLMQRLVSKGVLESHIRGKTCFYAPRLTREDVARRSLPGFLEVMLDGAFGPLVAYLAERRNLSEAEVAELRRMLADNTPTRK